MLPQPDPPGCGIGLGTKVTQGSISLVPPEQANQDLRVDVTVHAGSPNKHEPGSLVNYVDSPPVGHQLHRKVEVPTGHDSVAPVEDARVGLRLAGKATPCIAMRFYLEAVQGVTDHCDIRSLIGSRHPEL